MTVGIDDFAQRLVGPIDRLRLPAVGASVTQGAAALALGSGGKGVEMLSPVTGTVLAVNEAVARLARDGEALARTRDGWLFRVKSPQLAANMKSLMTGAFARRWMDAVTGQLGAEFTGRGTRARVRDGGTPVDGLARSLAHDQWDALARRYFLTDQEGGSHA